MISKSQSNQNSVKAISNYNSNQSAANCKKPHGIRGIIKSLFRLKSKSKRKHQKAAPVKIIKQLSGSSLSRDEICKLIRLYQCQGNLYNPEHPNYGDANIEIASYKRIAKYFPSKTIEELQRCIHELRMLFEREFIIIENGYRRFGEMLQPSITYYSEFLFLVPFLHYNWDSGAYLPPKETSTEDSIPNNSITSDGTDMARESPRSEGRINRSTAGKCFFFKKAAKKKSKRSSDFSLEKQSDASQKTLQSKSENSVSNEENASKKQQSLNEAEVASNKQLTWKPDPSDCSPNCPGVAAQAACNPECPLPASMPVQKSTATAAKSSLCSPNCPGVAAQTACNPECPLPASMSEQKSTATAASSSLCRRSGNRAPYKANSYDASQKQQKPQAAAAAVPCSPGTREQLDMLCEMIHRDLAASPDFIYYDAKWRILEILREVQKRKMIHSKTDGCKSGPSSAPPVQRMCYPANAARCPYCCKR